ncbi:MAG: PASTA domain-containing protein [Candidatus Zixiibacteriota bacterium]
MMPLRNYFRLLIFYVGIPAIALLTIFLFADGLIMPAITRRGEEFPLPTLVGKTEFEAQDIAAKSDVSIEIAGREYSSDKPEGVILVQMPEAGAFIKSGRSVKVVVSSGMRVEKIPDVHGLPLSQANIALQKSGFVLGDIYPVRVDSLPKNTAIETIPSQGTLLPLGSRVSIAVNQGPESGIITMPSLLGMPLDRAREQIENLGLVLDDIKRKKEDRYLPNTVLEQRPERNEQVMKGEKVKLTVSKTD